MICVYGYSFVSYLPASLFMMMPYGIIKTLVAIVGCAVSCLFIKNHMWASVDAQQEPKFRYLQSIGMSLKK